MAQKKNVVSIQNSAQPLDLSIIFLLLKEMPDSFSKTSFLSLILVVFSSSSLVLCSAWNAEWIEFHPSQSIHPPRSGHVAFSLNDEVYVFGGYAEEIENEKIIRYATNDLWKLNPKGPTWENVNTKELHVDDCDECNDNAKIPQQRLAAAVGCIDSSAYVFGGWDPQTPGTGGVILDGISEYNPSSDGWNGSVLKQVNLGETTSRHVAINIGKDTILLHNHRCTDSVLLFRKDDQAYSLQSQATTGTPPSPRGLHAACKLLGDNSNQVLVFGGAAQDGTMSNQVFVLDTTTWSWKELSSATPISKMPAPRASPCVCSIDEQTCIVFGGASPSKSGGLHGWDDLWIMKTDLEAGTVEWEELMVDNAVSPQGRNAATLTAISKPSSIGDDDGSSSQYFILTGGWYPFVKTHGDNFILKVTAT